MQPLPSELIQFIDAVNRAIINPLIGLLMVAALFLFIWGGLQFIRNADSSAERETGKAHMMWGLIGLMIMISTFAILNVGLRTFGVSSGSDYPSEIPL